MYDLSTNTCVSVGAVRRHTGAQDYDGDGRTDLAIWRPSTATWFIYYLGTGTTQSIAHGVSSDIPVR